MIFFHQIFSAAVMGDIRFSKIPGVFGLYPACPPLIITTVVLYICVNGECFEKIYEWTTELIVENLDTLVNECLPFRIENKWWINPNKYF